MSEYVSSQKLRLGQVFCCLVLSDAFLEMCRFSAFTLEGMIGGCFAILLQFGLCFSFLWIYRKGFSFSDYVRTHKVLPIVLLLRRGNSLFRLEDTSGALSLPFTRSIWAAVLIVLACFYTASLGIQALARSSSFIFGILLFTLAVMLIGAIPQGEIGYLTFTEHNTVWRGFWCEMGYVNEVVLLFLLLDFVEIPKKIYDTPVTCNWQHIFRKVSVACIFNSHWYDCFRLSYGSSSASFFFDCFCLTVLSHPTCRRYLSCPVWYVMHFSFDTLHHACSTLTPTNVPKTADVLCEQCVPSSNAGWRCNLWVDVLMSVCKNKRSEKQWFIEKQRAFGVLHYCLVLLPAADRWRCENGRICRRWKWMQRKATLYLYSSMTFSAVILLQFAPAIPFLLFYLNRQCKLENRCFLGT